MFIESEDCFLVLAPSLELLLVTVVEHLETEEELVVVVVAAPLMPPTLPPPCSCSALPLLLLLGELRCEVQVELVEGGWCSLSMPLSCWSKLLDLVDDVDG